MGTILYYLITFAEAGLGVVGIRGLYEQPKYTVVERLPGAVEVRDYAPRVAAETDDDGGGSVAFPRLFRYITGNNTTGEKIEMTAPVAQERGPTAPGTQERAMIAMTVPVQSSKTPGVMRFFLPADVVAKGVPKPLDPAVRIVTVPSERIAALRFSGWPDRSSVAAHDRLLLATLATAGLPTEGAPYLLTYDAPFTIPFLRRNEVAVTLSAPTASTPANRPHPAPAG